MSYENMLSTESGRDKLVSLRDAIAGSLQPGNSIFLGWNANAAVCEIMRQYRGKHPAFTVVMTMTWDHALNLVHCGLVRKLISTNCSYSAPAPGPSHVIQRASRAGAIEIENWSLYSMQQRLMAGALGVGFMPTKSIAGSTMEIDNRADFVRIQDPFDGKKQIGAVRSLNTDISIVHALAADAKGNAIVSPVSQDTVWGPRASTGGIIVTAEKIVPYDYICRHAHLVTIPGYLVKSVSLCTLGAHPQGQYSPIVEIEGYAEDYDFMLDQKKASADPTSLNKWLDYWVFATKDHSAYVNLLGSARISALKHRYTVKDHDLCPQTPVPFSAAPAGNTENMVIAASRKIAETIKKQYYKVLLAGIGIPGLAAWLAYYRLKKEGVEIDLALGSGVLGYQPLHGDPNPMSVRYALTATMLTNTSDMYGFIISGNRARCLSVIGAAQIDPWGNINTTRVGNNLHISGSGGNNDNTSSAAEVMVVVAQSKKRCVESVDYITSHGGRVSTLLTSMGIFTKGKEGRFILSECLPAQESVSLDNRIAQIQDNCSWKLEVADSITFTSSPESDELRLLRSLDPQNYLLKD